MEYLFQYIPITSQICNLKLVFSTEKNGYSLKTLYSLTENYEQCKGVIFLIKITTSQVFGGFCDKMFKLTQVYYIGSDSSFVFGLKPEREVYRSKCVNTYFLCCDTDHVSFGGGGEGEAIRINENFETGETNSSETFGNKPFVEGKMFKCSEFELYALV